MTSKTLQWLSLVFLVIALPFPVLRLLGSRDADLPAFGVLLMSMLIVSGLIAKIIQLESAVQQLQQQLRSRERPPGNT